MSEGKGGASSLEKLTFALTLLDNLSGPLGKVQERLTGIRKAAGDFGGGIKSGISQFAAGYVGAFAAVEGFVHSLEPAFQIDEALHRVRGSTDDLQRSAMKLNGEFGGGLESMIGMLDTVRAKTGLNGKALEEFGSRALKLGSISHTDQGTITDLMLKYVKAGATAEEAQRHVAALILSGGSNDPRLNAPASAGEKLRAFRGEVENLAIVWGQQLLPVATWFLDRLIEGKRRLVDWMTRFPTLTRVIAFATLGTLALVLAGSALAAVMGLAAVAFVVLTSPISLVILGVIALAAGVAALVAWWDDLSTPIKVVIAALLPFVFIPALIIRYWEPIKKFFADLWEILAKVGGFIHSGISATAGLLPDSIKTAIGLNAEDLRTLPAGEVTPGAGRALANIANNTDSRRSITQINNIKAEKADPALTDRWLSFAAWG